MRSRVLVAVLMAAVVVGMALGLAPANRDSDLGVERAAVPNSVTSLLRQTSSYEYTPYSGPAEMLDQSDVAVVGRVHHLQAAVVKDEIDGRGALVVALDPTEEWKGTGRAHDGFVYFALPRPNNLGVGAYRQVMPAGTEVVLFGGVHTPSTDFVSGDPGVTTYVPDPQGLFIAEPGAEIENVWANEVAQAWGDIGDLDSLRTATLGR
jgi:hypothetical protein